MGNENNQQGPVQGLSGSSEKMSPWDRFRQYQELQRLQQQHLNFLAESAATPSLVKAEQAQPGEALLEPGAVFHAQQVSPVAIDAKVQPTAQKDYAAVQVSVDKLFGADPELAIIAPPWKVLDFGPPQFQALLDTPAPLAEPSFESSNQAVQLKQGNLVQLAATGNAPGSERQTRLVLLDDEGKIKGAQFKDERGLARALKEVPQYAQSLLRSVFGEAAKVPSNFRVLDVKRGQQSSYEVSIEQRNPVDGKRQEKTVLLNNFGLKVPPSSNDPHRFDLAVAAYTQYLDHFVPASLSP